MSEAPPYSAAQVDVVRFPDAVSERDAVARANVYTESWRITA